jgi:ribonuclease Z
MSAELTVVLLGTGSPLPDPHRAGPSTLLRGEGLNVLVDCGRAVVMRLTAAGVLPLMLDAVLLTHLHSDHICDLNDVITTRWVMTTAPSPLTIYGPVGTKRVVDGILAMLASDIEYRLAHHADLNYAPDPVVVEVSPGDEFNVGDLHVRVGATDHRPVEPTVAYRVERDGTSVVFAGDGVPCAELDELVSTATAYVQTAIRDDLVAKVPSARFQDILDYHSTVAQAADTAERAGVGTLILTHYVPSPALGNYDEWRAAASGFKGQLILGDDLTSVTLSGS